LAETIVANETKKCVMDMLSLSVITKYTSLQQ